MAYQQTYQNSEQEMQQAYGEVMDGLISKMKKICETLGKERGYTIILEINEGGVVYSNAALDITAEVVKRYDAQAGG